MLWNDAARIEQRRDAVRHPSDSTGREGALIASERNNTPDLDESGEAGV